jgi:mitochondrial fission protein ELM1
MPDEAPQPSLNGERALSPLVVWAVSDGRAGNANPALGLAEALARRREAEIVVKTIAWTGPLGRAPWFLNPLPRRLLTPESGIAPPWPDVWIAAGRATVPLSMRMRRWSGGRTFVVQVQDPRAPTRAFDLVVAPRHDRTRGDNVTPITGSPHRVTADRLAAELARFAAELEPLPHPRVAVLIGGNSKAFELTPERADVLAREIEQAVRNARASVMVTFSRRTPARAKSILSARLGHLPGTIWDGHGDNPYFAFLAAADVILVTEESANMATEAAATGKPVLVLELDGESAKFARLHADLAARGVSRPFTGALETWAYPPLNETDRAAGVLAERLEARGR